MANKIRGTRNKPVTYAVDRIRQKSERQNLKDFGIDRVPRQVRAAAEEFALKHKVTLAVALEQICISEGTDVLRLCEGLKQQSKNPRRRTSPKAQKKSSYGRYGRSNETRYSFIKIYQGGAPGLGRRR